MAKRSKPSRSSTWSNDWEVGVRVWVERQGRAVLGEGRADLLAAIDRTHSISAAARLLGMSYRHAWNLVQEANSAAGQPLVEAATGGLKGGGARLTPRGRRALEIFANLRDEVRSTAAAMLQKALLPSTPSDVCVHLAAAISLQEVVGQVLTEFALRRPNLPVRAVFGASNELADHVLAGAPCDLFISADAAHLDRLAKARLLMRGSRRAVAANSLAAIGPRGFRRWLRKPSDLAAPRLERVALADPACPLGAYSKAYLERARCYDAVLPKALRVDSSRAVLAALASGRAQVGLAFASDAAGAADCEVLFSNNARADALWYWAAVARAGRCATEAGALLEFFSTDAARRCFGRCGFLTDRGAPRSP